MLPAVPAGLPSDLLLNRPDIRQAEENLVAANANIGVAKAQYYPTISLTGLFGFASMDLSNLFHGPAKMWSYAAPVTARSSRQGNRGAGPVGRGRAATALWSYQQVIQTAFREVDDSLVDHRRTREQLAALPESSKRFGNMCASPN